MTTMERYFSIEELDAGLAALGASPQQQGTVELIACRPQTGARQVVEQAEFSAEAGLIGDNWRQRFDQAAAGEIDPETQVTLMNSRVIQAITQDRALWAQAGDQLYVDFDLSAANLPPGQRLAVGSVVLEVSAIPHTGCSQFRGWFGHAALRFVNDNEVKHLNRRGINARVVQAGTIRTGDAITKL